MNMGRFSSFFTRTVERKSRKPANFFLAVLVCALAVAVGYALYPWHQKVQTPVVPEPAVVTNKDADAAKKMKETSEAAEKKMGTPYEEALGSPLEQRIKQVDHAIVSAFLTTGVQPGRIRIEEIESPALSPDTTTSGYHYQRIVLHSEMPSAAFLEKLDKELQHISGQVQLETQGNTWRIVIDALPTHELKFDFDAAQLAQPASGEGQLVIVMDDLGLSAKVARRLAALPLNITFSVLPRLPHSQDVARIAKETGHELMLHQPMQPVDSSINPGPGALKPDMKASTINRIMAVNLMDVPGASGFNNHMGSLLTQDPKAMATVVDIARTKGLFILDSVTHAGSVLAATAKAAGVRVLRRDIFLDVVRNTESILFQLHKAEQMARSNGSATAICHPYPETLEALRLWSEARDPEVEIVAASRLLDSENSKPLAQKGISR